MEGGTAQPRAPTSRCVLGFVPSQLAGWGCSAGRAIFSQLSSVLPRTCSGREKRRQAGPQTGGNRACSSPHGSQKHRRAQKGRDPQGSRSPHPSHLRTHTHTHTHISSNSAFNPFSYKTSNTRPKISLKKTEMMGREHCRQDEAGSQSSAQAGEPSRTQRWLKNP